MYLADHAPPHFHVRYAEHEALIAIETGTVIAGALPRRAQGFVREWLEIHRDELRANWTRAQAREPLERIDLDAAALYGKFEPASGEHLTRRTVQPA